MKTSGEKLVADAAAAVHGESKDKTQSLALDYQRIGRNGKVRLTARLPDGTTYTDKVDVADAERRSRFLRGLCKGRKGIDRKAIEAELERIAGEVVERAGDDGDESDGSNQKPSQADLLVELAQGVELFHTPGGHDSEGYATISINGHRETWPITSKGFRRWLARLFYEKYGKAPGSQAMQDALTVIAGKAIHDGPEYPVEVRIADFDGAIWLDLADAEWRAVEVRPTGWWVVASDAVPVRFVRKRGMLPIPVPVSGGSVNEFRAMVNIPDDHAWVLFVCWLVAAFRAGRPFPLLAVNGEQGSAKSTACKMARALIDPNTAPLRRPPREDRDLMIAATNGWVVGFDNLSGIAPWLSDAICMLATGGGFATRELYSDGDEKLFDAIRPVIVNGIDDLTTRSDLLDRAIHVLLPTIPDEHRRDEAGLLSEFEQARPRILGALLDAVSAAMRNLSSVKLNSLPRMADFAKWSVAAESALPWPPGSFMAAYTGNRGSANALAIESSIVGPAIMGLMHGREHWSGMVRELLVELEAHHTDDRTRKRREWPTSARKFSGELRRLAPNLRRVKIHVTFGEHTSRGTPITLERVGKAPSPPSQPSQHGADEHVQGDNGDGRDDPLPPHSSGPISQALPDNVPEEWEERAAIMEYEADLPREQAEAYALEEENNKIT